MAGAAGWGLVKADKVKGDDAFRKLLDLALKHEWDPNWHIKRLERVAPRGQVKGNGYGVFFAVVATDTKALDSGFAAVRKELHFSPAPEVDEYQVINALEINW